ncbi:IclR family transcriptional regulator [Enterobacter hormaechei]|uniref:IclR family transcriptional regulator n=1 Tax=Enterobacter hormaechei TaxID=158836 RepID=UPI00390818B9
MSGVNALFVQSLAKAFHLLEVFSVNARPLTLKELAEAANIERSSAQRMAFTLVELGYLEKADNKSYRPGIKMLDRTFDYLNSNPLIERATPILWDLQQETQERVDLSLFDGTTLVFAIRRQTKRHTFYATTVGRRIQTYASAGGRATMSRLEEKEIMAILSSSDLRQITPKTLTNPDLILSKVSEARQNGFAVASEETILGDIGLGCAITDRAGKPIGAVHLSVSLAEWDEEGAAKKFGPLLISTGRALSG